MSGDGNPFEAPGPETEAAAGCPLSAAQQTRNATLFALNVSLIYLAAPIVYVGTTQAALFQRLGTTAETANLPSSMYLWATPLPVLFAWYFSRVRHLKPVLAGAYLSVATGGLLVAAALVLEAPTTWILVAVSAHAGLLGCALGVVATFQWELLGRGVSETRRGRALGLAFGAGPILAFVSALGSQLVLKGTVAVPIVEWPLHFSIGEISMPPLDYPWNFAALFAATAPIAILAALSAASFVVPLPRRDVERQPFVAGVLGGFVQFLSDRLIWRAALAYVLVYSGYSILTNISLYTKEVFGELLEDYVGYQNALRFGCKAVAGFMLGWLLSRTSPRAGLFVTTGLSMAAIVWALLATGTWFLGSFGVMGAGELMGAYFTYYLLCCSPKSNMRRNMAYTSLIIMPVGFAPVLYGRIADSAGFPVSFLSALALLAVTFVFIGAALPARPRPTQEEPDR